jgi:hypothetical protein
MEANEETLAGYDDMFNIVLESGRETGPMAVDFLDDQTAELKALIASAFKEGDNDAEETVRGPLN